MHRLVTAAPDNGLGFGLLRYANARTAPALARLGAPQVLFNYLGRFAAASDADWDTAPEADALRTAPDPDLGTPYLLEINAACHDITAGRAGAAGRAHLRRRGPRHPRPRRALGGRAARPLRAATEEVWPLSPLQEGLFVQASLAGDARRVHRPERVRLRRPARPATALAAAWTKVLERHPAIRLGFTADDRARRSPCSPPS